MIKIRTYFVTDEKNVTFDNILEFSFEFLYMTILPSLGVYLFFLTRNLTFFLFLIFPAFLKIKFQPKKISSVEMRRRGKNL